MLPMLPRRPILLGGFIAPLFWTGLIHSILGIVNPVLNQRIHWGWFVASQVAFGIVAGIVFPSRNAYAPGSACRSPVPDPGMESLRNEDENAMNRVGPCVLAGGARGDHGLRHAQSGGFSRSIPPGKIMDFNFLYARNCAGCHGADGKGGAAIGLGDPVYLAIADDATIRRVTADGVAGNLHAGICATLRRNADGRANQRDRPRNSQPLGQARCFARRRPRRPMPRRAPVMRSAVRVYMAPTVPPAMARTGRGGKRASSIVDSCVSRAGQRSEPSHNRDCRAS